MGALALRAFIFGAPGTALAFLFASAVAGASPQTDHVNSLNNVAGFDSIKTARFSYNIINGNFEFPGHFDATRGGTNITADRATGNSQRKQMRAEGHVVVHQNQALQGSAKTVDLTQRPSTLTCDLLDVDGNRKMYTATGNMHFMQEGGREASADHAVLDDANHHLHLEGHAHVRNGAQTIDSDVLDYDTVTGQLEGNGNVTITAPVETPVPGEPAPAATKKAKRRIL